MILPIFTRYAFWECRSVCGPNFHAHAKGRPQAAFESKGRRILADVFLLPGGHGAVGLDHAHPFVDGLWQVRVADVRRRWLRTVCKRKADLLAGGSVLRYAYFRKVD